MPRGGSLELFGAILSLFTLAYSSFETPRPVAVPLPCSSRCVCSGSTDAMRVDCSNMNWTSIPPNISVMTSVLDLSWNELTELPDNAFSSYRRLQELNLGRNFLSTIPKTSFSKLSTLRTLYLQNNGFEAVPDLSLIPLINLENLHMSFNKIAELNAKSFISVVRLQSLWLDGNKMQELPVSAIEPLTRLEALNLASNAIEKIPDYAFQTLKKLLVLVLHDNFIESVGFKAFHGLKSLKVLDLNGNRLIELPEAISSLPVMRELTFSDNQIQFLEDNAFQFNPELVLLEMSGNPIVSVAKNAFSNLPHLKELILSEARMLSDFPNLLGTSSLEHLRLDRAKLKSVPTNLCKRVPLLRSLNLKSNQLHEVPLLHECTELRLLDLSYNFIMFLDEEPFANQRLLIDLFLSHNQINVIKEDAFKGLENLQVLDLENNDIQDINFEAFRHFKDLRDLNLGANRFSQLPTQGLHNLRQLKVFNTRELKDFPPIQNFPRINRLAMSYAYHCCAFIAAASNHKNPSKSTSPLKETIVWLSKDDVDMASWNANITDIWPGYENFSTKFEEFANQLWKTFGHDYPLPDNLAQYAEEYFESNYGTEDHGNGAKYSVQCLPEPGPFMPCSDLFGWWSLRCGVWVVFLLALLGNGIVVLVLLVRRSKMDVPRFLVCNLAGADFFMGIYLGMLAVVDASTLGEFKVSAIKWQTSAGCQIAGFLGVLSSELSVFTLSVITLERNYAITHAMHLNKRLSLRHAGYIMFGGWAFACTMATLPLVGISDYRKFAICLPFETEDTLSLTYVVFLILINGVAFLILMGCYLKMYCTIRGSQAWNSNDSRIARRMALLVFTDFICWAPIAFFSLTAVCGVDLISLEEAKVFAIFVLPLNSCANPFLYAIFTKQFKKDCIHICKRIEESRVTRGIGRGRHSSNFSNRHTPIAMNSGGAVILHAGSNSDPSPQERLYNVDFPVCTCGIAWKPHEEPRRSWKVWALRYLLCQTEELKKSTTDNYAYSLDQIRCSLERRGKHASSISSENFSSRSDSWRQGTIPLRLMDQVIRKGSKRYQRKESQDSNMSCSRQDSSTSTFRMSRSSFSTDSSNQHRPSCSTRLPNDNIDRECHITIGRDGKPKLCRQSAVEEVQLRKNETMVDFDKHLSKEQQKETKCAFCTGKNISSPLSSYKSKDFEQKFNCFYNRLAESSHEESSNTYSSKDDQLVLLSDESFKSNDVIKNEHFTNGNVQNNTKTVFNTNSCIWLPVEIILDINNDHEIHNNLPEDQRSIKNSNEAKLADCKKSNFHSNQSPSKCNSLSNISQRESFGNIKKYTSENSSVLADKARIVISRSLSSHILEKCEVKRKSEIASEEIAQIIRSSKSENVVNESSVVRNSEISNHSSLGQLATKFELFDSQGCDAFPSLVRPKLKKKIRNSLSTPNIISNTN